MTTELVPLVILAVLVIYNAISWTRLIRRMRDPNWKETRYAHFLHNVELRSTCYALGHNIQEDGGCRWCDDLVPMWATEYGSFSYILDPTGEDVKISRHDGRIIGFRRLGWRFKNAKTQAYGIIWLDVSISRKGLPATSLAEQRAPSYHEEHGSQTKEEIAAEYNRPIAGSAGRTATIGRGQARYSAHTEY